MGHSLEWIEELTRAGDRLDARHTLRLAQAVCSMMDEGAWGDTQRRLIDIGSGNSYE